MVVLEKTRGAEIQENFLRELFLSNREIDVSSTIRWFGTRDFQIHFSRVKNKISYATYRYRYLQRER